MSFNELRLTLPQQQLDFKQESVDVYKDVLLNQLMTAESFAAQIEKVITNMHNLNRMELNGDTRYSMVIPMIQKYIVMMDSIRGRGPKSSSAMIRPKFLSELNKEMGFCCKLLMRDCVPHSLEEKSQFVFWTLVALTEQIKDHYEKYQTEPAGLWGEVNRLYEFAFHHRLNLFEPAPQYRSIDHCYKEICVLSAANPYRLTARESKVIYSWVRSWANKAILSHQESPEMNQRYFYLDLETNYGPLESRNLKTVANDSSVLALNPLPLIEKAKQHLSKLKKGAVPEQLGFKAGTDAIDSFIALKKVVQTLTHTASRKDERISDHHQVTLAVGLHSIHGLMKRTAKAAKTILQGSTVNVSRSGSCINVEERIKESQIQVGDVLAQKDQGQNKQRLAIVRWLKATKDNLLIGIEFIAGRAQPVALKIKDTLAEALLVSVANTDTLITDVGLYRNGEPISMRLIHGNLPVQAVSGPLVGRFGGTDQFRITRSIN